MKRAILGLIMLSSFALASAPAYAVNLECGRSYAVEIHGTEPELTADQPLHYIAAVGELQFGPRSGNPGSCTVTGGELIYNDNDLLTFSAGPAACYFGSSLLGGGIPCFDGGAHVTGTLSPSPLGNGSADLAILASFTWVGGGPAVASLPLDFTLQVNAGASIVMGNSVADVGPTPTSPPPGSPVLVITMQKQSTTVTLPVTGPGDQTGILAFGNPAYVPPSPLGSSGGGGNGFGVAPYLGLSVSLFQGYGAPSADPFSQPVQGSFGSTVSVLQAFPDGYAGGSASFSSNDNVGNTTGLSNGDCDTQVTQTGNFGDGTSNLGAAIVHPSLSCLDSFASATFELSNVAWGPTDTSGFSIVTGLSSGVLTAGELIPAGLMSDATSLNSAPAGKLTSFTLPTLVSINNTKTGYVKLTNSTPAGCDVTVTMATQTGSTGTWTCNMDLVGGSPQNVLAEGDTPATIYANPECACSGSGSAAANPVSITSSLSLSSSDCPNTSLTTPVTVTCKN